MLFGADGFQVTDAKYSTHVEHDCSRVRKFAHDAITPRQLVNAPSSRFILQAYRYDTVGTMRNHDVNVWELVVSGLFYTKKGTPPSF